MRTLSAVFFTILVMFPIIPAAAADEIMNLVTDHIINQPGVVRDGDKYVLETPPAGGTTTYARLTYTPASEKSIGSIELFVRSRHLTPNGKIVACDSLTIDHGLLGSVGPRDGYVACSGSLDLPSFSRILAIGRPRDYSLFIQAVVLEALLSRSTDWFVLE